MVTAEEDWVLKLKFLWMWFAVISVAIPERENISFTATSKFFFVQAQKDYDYIFYICRQYMIPYAIFHYDGKIYAVFEKNWLENNIENAQQVWIVGSVRIVQVTTLVNGQ